MPLVARQFTLADFKIFKKIQLSEYFHKGWTKRDKAGQVLSANICTLVANFNKMTSWVAGEIVFSRDEKSRLLTIVRFIELLEVKYNVLLCIDKISIFKSYEIIME